MGWDFWNWGRVPDKPFFSEYSPPPEMGKTSIPPRPHLKPKEPVIPMINTYGRQMIKDSEGLRLNAYLCSALVWTIGYGSTRGTDGLPVEKSDVINIDIANQLFERDINVFSFAVRKLLKVPVTVNQFSALVSLAYNIGIGNFRASTLLRKLNRGDTEGASQEFWKWRRANGKILPGLVARRERERILFTSV
jgi:lysozyme